MRLTKRKIDAADYDADGTKRQVLWDDSPTGLGLRLNPGGTKTFVLSYRTPGTRRKRLMVLGRYGVLTLSQARDKARAKLGEVAEGLDPLTERERQEAEEARQESLAAFARRYLEDHSKEHKRSWKEDQRRIENRIIPALGKVPLEDLEVGDVASLHRSIGREGSKVEANRVVELLRGILNMAVTWGSLPRTHQNPANAVKLYEEESRDRWVRPAEIGPLMEAIGEQPDPWVRSFYVLLLLTGSRKSELLRAKWEDVDLDRRELRIPQTKQRKPHVIPLSGAALQVLENVPRQLGNPHIFCGRKPRSHLVNVSKSWRRIRERAGLPDVTIHDLRRTTGSWLAMSGASLPVIGKVLGHRDTAATQVYARLAEDAGREALEDHGRRLLEAAGGSLPTVDVA